MSSDRVWQRYGEEDPYYGVLTLPSYRRASIAANRDAFFATGEAAVAATLARVEAAVGEVARGRALDFGAGVGRLSLPLAARFARVDSVDVAPGMLRELRGNAGARGLANVATHARLSEVAPGLDFALSLIVLQHVAEARGRAVVLEAYDRLAPGGVLALEVPIATRHAWAWQASRALRDRLPPAAQGLWNRLRGRPAHDGGMRMTLYALDPILAALFARGAGAVTALPTEPDPNFTGALIVCRKGA